jgi:hypothetical protein
MSIFHLHFSGRAEMEDYHTDSCLLKLYVCKLLYYFRCTHNQCAQDEFMSDFIELIIKNNFCTWF